MRNGHSWLLAVARCGRNSHLKERRENASENETRKEKKNKINEASHPPPHPMFLSIIVICYDSRVLCKCLRVCVCEGHA